LLRNERERLSKKLSDNELPSRKKRNAKKSNNAGKRQSASVLFNVRRNKLQPLLMLRGAHLDKQWRRRG
jgi:hypothetical protein